MVAARFPILVNLFHKWAANRRPKGKEFELNQKRIFIFPTLAGWMFLALCIVIFLIGTNYQNNLIHAVAFFLIAMGVLCIHYTFLNLSGLKIKILKGFNCYAGERAEFQLQLSSVGKRSYQGVILNWQGQPSNTVELSSGNSETVHLYAQTENRGVFSPGHLLVETRFPFGLLRAWSWLEPEVSILVYPSPVTGRSPIQVGSSIDGEHSGKKADGDDFFGLNEYQPGESSRKIAWKQFAKGRGLLSKNFVGHQDRKVWLHWEDWPELSLEQKLCVICYWAQKFEHQSVEYGLVLPEVQIDPSSGPSHFEKVLSALALHGNR